MLVSIHKGRDRNTQITLMVSLMIEFLGEAVDPRKVQVAGAAGVGHICHLDGHRQSQATIIRFSPRLTIGVVVGIGEARLEVVEDLLVHRHVGGENDLAHGVSDLFAKFFTAITENVLFWVLHHLEGGGKMVILKDGAVVVECRQVSVGSVVEGVVEARMIEVMNSGGHDGGEDFLFR